VLTFTEKEAAILRGQLYSYYRASYDTERRPIQGISSLGANALLAYRDFANTNYSALVAAGVPGWQDVKNNETRE
jgi:hypothetical protein